MTDAALASGHGLTLALGGVALVVFLVAARLGRWPLWIAGYLLLAVTMVVYFWGR